MPGVGRWRWIGNPATKAPTPRRGDRVKERASVPPPHASHACVNASESTLVWRHRERSTHSDRCSRQRSRVHVWTREGRRDRWTVATKHTDSAKTLTEQPRMTVAIADGRRMTLKLAIPTVNQRDRQTHTHTENANSKTISKKDFSLGSVKTCPTTGPCTIMKPNFNFTRENF